jgi:hypothetical protein
MLMVVAFAAVIAVTWHQDDSRNARRMNELQADPLLRCHVAQIVPWHAEDVNSPGSTHGIGFGGTSPTMVARGFYLNGADPAQVLATFAICAHNSSWVSYQQTADNFSATKTFPGGWQASLTIGVSMHAPFANQPIVQVVIESEAV